MGNPESGSGADEALVGEGALKTGAPAEVEAEVGAVVDEVKAQAGEQGMAEVLALLEAAEGAVEEAEREEAKQRKRLGVLKSYGVLN